MTALSSPNIPTASKMPESPTSVGYASSDHASAGSCLFSRSTSSGSSQSSHPDDPATDDIRRGDHTPLTNAPTAPAAPSGAVALCHVHLSSSQGHSPPSITNAGHDEVSASSPSPNAGAGAVTSTPPHDPDSPTPVSIPVSIASPVPLPKRETVLDRLKSSGQEIPEYVFALQSDTTEEMIRLATDVQKHVVAVDDSHGDRLKAIEERLGSFELRVDKHFGDVQRRFDAIGDGVETVEQEFKGSGQVTAASTDILTVMKQHFDELAKKGEQRSIESTQAMKKHLAESTKALEQRLDTRLSEFKEEMSGSFTQLKEDVGAQIREELGGEQRKYDSTLALQAFADEAVDTANTSIMERVEMLFQFMEDLSSNLPVATESHAPVPHASAHMPNSPTDSLAPVPDSPALVPDSPAPFPKSPVPFPDSPTFPSESLARPPPPPS